MAMKIFSGIENRNTRIPKWSENPYKPDQLMTRTHIVPFKDLKLLKLIFPLPDLRPYFRSSVRNWNDSILIRKLIEFFLFQPAYHWIHLIAHQGKGSVISELKKRGWATELQVYRPNAAHGFDFFTISVDLTDEGLGKVDEIITMLFQAINLIKTNGVVKRIFHVRTIAVYFIFC